MNPKLQLEIAAISIIHLLAIVISVICLTVFLLKTRRDDHTANSFAVMQGAMILWMVFKIFKTVSPDVTTRWICILGYYACTCILEMAFIEFGYSYSRGRPLSNRIRRWIYILPLMQFSWILTNPFHFLFYSRYDFVGDSFGPLFYVHMALEYGFIVTGFYFCSIRFKREFSQKNKLLTYIVSTAIITPLVLNLLYITRVVQHITVIANIPVLFDITPIVFTWSTLLFMYVTFNHEFFKLTPLMRHEITHELTLAMGVFDEKFTLGYANAAFRLLTKQEEKIAVVLAQLSRQASLAEESGYEQKIQDESFWIFCKKIKYLRKKQYLVSIKDISTYKNIQADIKEKQTALAQKNQDLNNTIANLKQLSRTSARKYVARELHDIIGHSLVTAVKLMEVSKIYMAGNRDLGLLALDDAIKAIDTGLSGIKSIPFTTSDNKVYTGEQLKKTIQNIIEKTKYINLEVRLHFQGMIYVLDHGKYDTLTKICIELLTNCMKHANASKLFISLKINEARISLLSIDNGEGAASVTRGSGLLGMEERIKALNGQIQFSASDGFMTRVSIPRHP